jgi:hypothetical protein
MAVIAIVFSDTDEPGKEVEVQVLRSQLTESQVSNPTMAEKIARTVEGLLEEIRTGNHPASGPKPAAKPRPKFRLRPAPA